MSPETPVDVDVSAVLDRFGFDQDESVLTRRQAEVLVLRERDFSQAVIATHLGTSRANVANIEGSARTNIARAEETIRFVEAVNAPIQVPIPAGTDIYDVPDAVYAACDEADLKVEHTAPDLMKRILDGADAVVHGRTVESPLTIVVNANGEILVRHTNADSDAD